MKTHPGSSRGRILRGLVAVCVASLVVGCSVFEEVDKLGKDPKKDAAKAASEAEAGLPAVPEGSNQAKLRAYYNRKAKPVEEDAGNPIVSCALRDGKSYMRLDDCELRGGRVAS